MMDPDLQHLLSVMRDKGILRITHDYPLTEAQDASDTDIEVWYAAPELGVNGRRRQHYNSNQIGTGVID